MRRRTALVFALALAPMAFAGEAAAAEPWVDRPMTLRRLVFAGDVGVGVGHDGAFPRNAQTGPGMNLEAALGVTDRFELGLRSGLRFGDGARVTGADGYGRTLWTETYGRGGDAVANPELRGRGVLYRGTLTEVGLDGRVVVPVETGTEATLVFGVPLAFHVSDWVRIDTGAYLPIATADPRFALAIPGYVWFQTSSKLWLGPMARLSFVDAPGGNVANLLVGFGLGVQVAPAVDLKTMLLFPTFDDDARRFGIGFGVQFRIGE